MVCIKCNQEKKTPKNLRNTSRNFTYEEKKEAVLSLTNNDFKNSNSKPYVLIIDEINRGNVSQIFGELITLIEEDKRSGKPEALEVTLPYSKEKFSVPPNLYIIGTMNTADRSVEALDAALRRRFSFEEMLPLYDLEQIQYEYANTSASEILKTINGRIEKLTDKDHQIGHSYFFRKDDENAEATLMNAFYLKIIPLLQEYFFGDFGKIGLVLGEGFVKLKEWDNNSDGFADFAYESAEDFEKREIYEIIDYRKKKNYLLKRKNKDEITIDFENAIQLLMKQKID
ncbi:MAG: McrB family protein [Bacteroidia bacterium]